MAAQKLAVTWAPERVRGAVERAAAIVAKSNPDQGYDLRGVRLPVPDIDGPLEVVSFGQLSWMDLACLVDAARAALADSEDEAGTSGPWTILPDQAGVNVWYQVLGEEDAETLMIRGHKLGEDAIAAAIRHAGFGRVLDIMDELNGLSEDLDGVPVGGDLEPVETWATELRDCPKHGRLPRVARQWLRNHWGVLESCAMCEHVYHYRTCSGCGFCSSDGSGRVPPCWDWITDDHKLFYLPGELKTITARLAQITADGTQIPEGVEPRIAKEFQGLVAGAREIREELESLGYQPVTVVSVAG